MSFFQSIDPYINDERWPTWPETQKSNYDPKQTEIQYFFPLTEQIDLELDRPEQPKPTLTYSNTVLSEVTGTTWVTASTSIAPAQLTVKSGENVGSLEIGKIEVGLDIAPKWYQKVLYKLLGFNWKDK